MCVTQKCHVRCDKCKAKIPIPDRTIKCKDVGAGPIPKDHKIETKKDVEIVRYGLCEPHKAELVEETGGYRYTHDPKYGKNGELER